ncbi:hypothetical protein Gpo141_00006117 [Globisporangium polare]
MSSTKRLAHQVSATPSPRSSRMEEAAQRGSFSTTSDDSTTPSGPSSTSSSSSDDSAVTAPPASMMTTGKRTLLTTTDGMPRTTEILWNGVTSLGFTLKRKRKTGAILVSKLKEVGNGRQLRVGSELKLVGGFPVKQLTLDEVKKVMLKAPKPVSLVFLNKDDALVQLQHTMQLVAAADSGKGISRREASGSFITDCSDDRGSFDNEFVGATPASAAGTAARAFLFPAAAQQSSAETANTSRPSLHRSVSAFAMTTPAATLHHPLSPSSSSSGYTTYTNYYAKPSDHKSKKRKVSKLRVALDRMSQLLNRPVRQSALNIPAGKSIVV